MPLSAGASVNDIVMTKSQLKGLNDPTNSVATALYNKLKAIFDDNPVKVSCACDTILCGSRGGKTAEYPRPYPADPTPPPKFVTLLSVSDIPSVSMLDAGRIVGEAAVAFAPRVAAATAEVPAPAGPGGAAVSDKTCKAFYGPITSSGGAAMPLTFSLSIAVGAVQGTLSVSGAASMSTQVVDRSLTGTCDPPTCSDETKLTATVKVTLRGNMKVSASMAVSVPVIGAIGPGASAAVNFDIFATDMLQVVVNAT